MGIFDRSFAFLESGLAYEDAETERRFHAFYSESFAPYARKMLLLVVLLLVADFLVDLTLLPGRGTPGNWLRLTVVLPMFCGTFLLSGSGWYRRHWQFYMALVVAISSVAIFLVLLKVDEEGGYGFSSMVGVLNFTFAIVFCFVVLGIQFRYSIVSGTAVLLAFLYLMSTHSALLGQHRIYYSYHIITLFILIASVGWAREKYIRRDFKTTLIAESEREKADRVLANILPKSIAARIKNGEYPIAESHGEATILFADIQGFTVLASKLGPKHLVELLGAIFTGFDTICSHAGIEKIKTIGDAYMGVSGVPEYHDDHAAQAVRAGQQMIDFIARLSSERQLPLSVRVGIHTGPVIGGVIGTTKYHYDLWGDAVNIASRIESSGVAGSVQVSEATYWRTNTQMQYECRGEIELKGKGRMTTYLLRNVNCAEGNGGS